MQMAEISKDLAASESPESGDSVLQMLGVGRDLWTHESGDSLVSRLRSAESSEPEI